MTAIRFKDACRLWEAEKLKYVKASSLAAYSFVIRKHLEPRFLTLDDITDDSIQEMVDSKLKDGLGLTMVKRIVLVLEMVTRFCERRGWTGHHFFKPIYPARTQKYEADVLSTKEERKLARYLADNPTPRNLGLLICICCGLRNGEICALRWSDIDFDNKVIYIRRTVFRLNDSSGKDSKSRLVIGNPKTPDSRRYVPVTGSLIKLLQGVHKDQDGKAFIVSGTSKPADPQTFRNNFKKVLGKLGLKKHKVHSLRHTFATRCVESRCDIKTLSSILGHSNISTTLNLYVHPGLEQKRKCVENRMKLL